MLPASATASCGMSFAAFFCFRSDSRQTTPGLSASVMSIRSWGTNISSQPMKDLASTHASKKSRRRILSVDDEPGILFTRKIILENAGYDVLNAADGEQALHFFAIDTVDLQAAVWAV